MKSPSASSARALMFILATSVVGGVLLGMPGLVGLHMDEAWSILAAEGRIDRANSLSGMTGYVGAIQTWILPRGVGMVGLRWLSGVLNLAAVCCVAWAGTRNERRPWITALVLACMGTLPTFVVYARFAIELTMFGLPLFFGGLLLLRHGHRWSDLAGGVAFGLLAYNHLAHAPAAVVGLVACGWLGRSDPRALAMGFALGLAPRLLSMLLWGMESPEPSPVGDAFADMVATPEVMGRLFDGSLVFRRFAGVELGWGRYVELGFAILLLWLLWARTDPWERLLGYGLLVAGILTAFFAPRLSLRYLHLPSVGMLWLGIFVSARLVDQVRPLGRSIIIGLLLALTTWNLVALHLGYHRPFASGAPSLVRFELGSRNQETNAHFFPKQDLFVLLEPHGSSKFIVPHSLELPIRVGVGVRAEQIVSAPPPNQPSVFVRYSFPETEPDPQACLAHIQLSVVGTTPYFDVFASDGRPCAR